MALVRSASVKGCPAPTKGRAGEAKQYLPFSSDKIKSSEAV